MVIEVKFLAKYEEIELKFLKSFGACQEGIQHRKHLYQMFNSFITTTLLVFIVNYKNTWTLPGTRGDESPHYEHSPVTT